MWKSEGYFHNVVWENYKSSYEWILGEVNSAGGATGRGVSRGGSGMGKKSKGVWIKPVDEFMCCEEEEKAIERMVEWGVDVLLYEMGRLEERARRVGGIFRVGS